MIITQQQAEAMVYEQLRMDYTEEQIKEMPYRVTVSDDKVISDGIGDDWRDVYKIEYVPQLMLIGHEL